MRAKIQIKIIVRISFTCYLYSISLPHISKFEVGVQQRLGKKEKKRKEKEGKKRKSASLCPQRTVRQISVLDARYNDGGNLVDVASHSGYIPGQNAPSCTPPHNPPLPSPGIPVILNKSFIFVKILYILPTYAASILFIFL